MKNGHKSLPYYLDDVDRRLCEELQSNGRAQYSGLAERVGLSVPAVRERIIRLEQRGVIRGFSAVLNAEAFGLDLTVFVFVSLAGSDNFAGFIDLCRTRPDIQECHAITGQASHLLKIRARNRAALEMILSEIQRWPGVHGTQTHLVLSTHAETHAIDTSATEERELAV